MNVKGLNVKGLLSQLLGSLIFYTSLPLPATWKIEFQGIARFAPFVGVLIGAVLGLLTLGLAHLGMPPLTRGVLVVVIWIVITGGLHLDGVMDLGDGLATTDRDRRLEVMADSKTGAFGVMAGLAVILIKVAALVDLNVALINQLVWQDYLFLTMAVAGWGRWGQLLAIFCYPYLRSQGKGAFHKESINSIWDLVPATLILLGLAIAQIALNPNQWILATATCVMGMAIASLTGAWINWQLSGHTGDTYGAIVEWTEALLLCILTVII